MKFISTSGREYSVDIRPSRWKLKEENGRGVFQSEVGALLSRVFGPSDYVLEEFPLPGEGLYLDFFLPSHMIAIEVQGTQHTKYNPFFHKDRAAFLDGQKRDRRKASWCEINKIRLVLIDYNETTENIIKKINLALK